MSETKNYSFVAYIDESGDDGLNMGQNGFGPSHWFVLSALIVRKSVDLELPQRRDEIVSEISLQRSEIHMKKIKNHDQKLLVAKRVSEIPSRHITILSNKYSILNSERNNLFHEKNTYYNYMGRYLIERISKCCSALRPRVSEGNGKVKIIFSKRGGMSYQAFRDYMSKLKEKDTLRGKNISGINWNVVDIDLIDAKAHSERAGLQLVDVIAYSFFKAVEKNHFGMTDCSYLNQLKRNADNRFGSYLHNGVKIIPDPETLPKEEIPEELIESFQKI